MGPGNYISLHVGVSCISLAVQARAKEMEVAAPHTANRTCLVTVLFLGG